MGESSLRYAGWLVVAASCAGVFFASLFFYVFAVFLKPLTDEFSWSREAVATAYGAMTLATALSAPLVGVLVDRFGPNRIGGPSLMLAASAFASLSLLTPNVWHLYGVFALIGLAATGSTAVVYSRAVSSWFDRRRGAALAAVFASAAFGSMVNPVAAQMLIEAVGWRTACLVISAVIVAVGAPVVMWFVRERAAVESRSASVVGASVREALGSRVFWTLIAVVFGSMLALNSVIVHLSALLTDRGVTPGQAALAVSTMGAASFLGRLTTGWLLDRFMAVRVAFVLLVISALGTFLLTGVHAFPVSLAAAALIGFGTGGETDVVPYLVSRYFGLRSLSTLYGLHWTAWGLAGAVGPRWMGRTFDATGSYDATLVALSFATLGVAALLLTLPAYANRVARPAAAG